MNTKQAIEKVLTGKSGGMRVPAIIEAGVPLATSLKGKTPGQTFYSTLYAENKKDDGLVVQVSRGMFKLNPKRKPIGERTTTVKPTAARKTAAKKTTARKAGAKKTTARKPAAKKTTARKSTKA